MRHWRTTGGMAIVTVAETPEFQRRVRAIMGNANLTRTETEAVKSLGKMLADTYRSAR
jgi:hypothetical protein